MQQNWTINLPAEPRPFPEPTALDGNPGFRVRGTKGWNWTAQQYLDEIPTLLAGKMNFLMNCYLSMYSDPEQYRNEWWLPIPEPKRQAYASVFRSARDNGIDFCFATNPQLHAPRPLDLASSSDVETLLSHYLWAQSQGVRWFCLALDDIGGIRIDPSEHAALVNTLLDRLGQADPEVQMIFCPTHYWGDGTSDYDRPYLQTLAQALHRDVYVFWTGRDVYAQQILRQDAESFRSIVRHRLIVWDNYPVNDANPTMHLGPVTGRDADLPLVADGYMANPMCPQNQASRIPLLTCADYAYNPSAYDPTRSIGQAIVHLGATELQWLTLKHLVETYPGALAARQMQSSYNSVRERFLRADPSNRASLQVHLAKLLAQLQAAFHRTYQDAADTIAADLRWMCERTNHS